MPRRYVKGEREESRGYSRSVATEGGKAVWLAGVGGGWDAEGRSQAGDFEAQCRTTLDNLRDGVEAAGGTMEDIVAMTVFVTDMRYGDRFAEMRREYLKGDFPGSTLIGIESLARPEMMVEIQAIAVIGDS